MDLSWAFFLFSRFYEKEDTASAVQKRNYAQTGEGLETYWVMSEWILIFTFFLFIWRFHHWNIYVLVLINSFTFFGGMQLGMRGRMIKKAFVPDLKVF